MNELLFYTAVLKDIVDRHYEKETIFYDNGEWYSRYHSKNISFGELKDWVMEITDKEEYHN